MARFCALNLGGSHDPQPVRIEREPVSGAQEYPAIRDRGLFFRPGDIRNLSELFLLNGITAQQMGHEIARYRATGCMDAQPVVTTIVEHATRPGSNVVLLNINSDRLKP